MNYYTPNQYQAPYRRRKAPKASLLPEEHYERRRKPIPAEDSPTFEQVKLIKERCLFYNKPKYSLILGLGFIMGLRRVEMTRVKVGHVHIGEQYLDLKWADSKGGYSGGAIPILERAFLEELHTYIVKNQLQPQDYLLNYSQKRKPYTTRRINYIVEEMGSWIGFQGLRPHLLRHARAKWLVQNKYPDRLIQLFLRHKHASTTIGMYNRFKKDEVMSMLHAGVKSHW